MNFFVKAFLVPSLALSPLLLSAVSPQPPLLSGKELWLHAKQLYTRNLEESRAMGLFQETAHFHHKLAEIELELGQYEAALDHVEQALAIYKNEEKTVKSRLDIVDLRVLKGRLFGFLNQPFSAVNELLEIYDETITLRGESDPETVRLYKHLGWHFGLLAKAEFISAEQRKTYLMLAYKHYEGALAQDLKNSGENNPDAAKSYSLLGWILGDLEQYDQALEVHKKALQIRIACYTEIHPNTARSYAHIAWCYEKLGDFEKTKEFYEITVRVMEQVLPDDHPELLKAKESLEHYH